MNPEREPHPGPAMPWGPDPAAQPGGPLHPPASHRGPDDGRPGDPHTADQDARGLGGLDFAEPATELAARYRQERSTAPAPAGGRWARFRVWRHQRPFWGGLLTVLFGVELYAVTAVPAELFVLSGSTFVGTLVLAITLVVIGVATWFQPMLRTITGPVVVVLALASLILSNFGGFGVGLFLGIFGGGMMFAWSPTKNAGRDGADAADDTDPSDLDGPGFDGPDDTAPVTDLGRHAERRGGSGLRYPPEHDRRRPGPGLLWLAPLAALGLLIAGSHQAPAHAAEPAAVPAAVPAAEGCILFIFCPEPTPTPTPTPTPSPSTSSAPLFPWLPGPSTSAPSGSASAPTPSSTRSCDPSDYPSSTQGANASQAASVLQACADDGTPSAAPTPDGGLPVVGTEAGRMTATKLDMENLTYHGILTLKTARGTVKVMDFSATKLTVTGMKLNLPFNGMTITMSSPTGTAVISGNVRLYTIDISGNAFGLLPLKFTPDPPPLLPPIPLPISFTDVTTNVAMVQADRITSDVSISVK